MLSDLCRAVFRFGSHADRGRRVQSPTYVLQFFFKIGQVMGSPEVGQFLDRISFGQLRLLHRFFLACPNSTVRLARREAAVSMQAGMPSRQDAATVR
jgi:hypothetical protein